MGNLAGLPLGDAVIGFAEWVWEEWAEAKSEQDRKAELEAIVRMAGDEFRKQVEVVVQQVAAGQPPAVKQRVTALLEGIPDLARKQFARSGDEKGRSVPPGFRLTRSVDLVPILSREFFPAPVNLAGVPRVSIRHTAGPMAGQEVIYTGPAVLLFGRADGCDPKIPQDKQYQVISRRHSIVEVNPPDVRIRDLGSRNGTYVNGHLIGKRPDGTAPAPGYESPEHDLSDGATVHLGDPGPVAFTVGVSAPVPAVRDCAWCKKLVTEPGANRPGMFVCGECRGNVRAMIDGVIAETCAQSPSAAPRAVGAYELREELGHGGMGAVFLARHRATGEPAAVKLMLPKVAADERAVALFQREVRNTLALSHRNVVRVHDHGYAKGAFFLVLEYCDGGSVDHLMAHRGGTLPVDEAVEIALQALDGLHYAHTAEIPFVRQPDGGFAVGRGLVHRDVKPANLFLTGWGSGRVVKVGDYGLAKGFDEAGLSGGTRTGDVAGTWEFMCRKQVIGFKSAGPEVDVWAVAASLYYMLTGHLPRNFPDGRDPWLVVLEDDPVPILKRNPKLPPGLAKVIDHALREEPEMPFQSAAALKRAIEEVA
ncbi:serine/threonine kinase [Fimbriiglobus ruber]|uniref:non-specific serine/threonine protein kinase n=1 Tax=Fimbriiglobus ruber TaxID=1908690 RepID=A0A225DMI8_9BACT|nr:serine/threonine kinase [Fimbriiglobus ruber]